MRDVRARTAVLLVCVFVAGGLSGGAIDRWLGSCRSPLSVQPPPGPAGLSGLNLTPEQEEKARAIGDRHRPELEAIRQEVMPRVLDIHDRMGRELREILTPSQQAAFDRSREKQGNQPPPDILGQGGPDGPPPPEAVEACAGSTIGARCSFEGRSDKVTGTCQSGPAGKGPTACVPSEGHHPGGERPASPTTTP